MRFLVLLGCVLASGIFSASVARADIAYDTILSLDDSLTGVRGTDTTNSGNVIITGSQIINGSPQTLLWQGNLYTGLGSSYNIMPLVNSGTVTSSNFYGPDTSAFNSAIPSGQVRAVGTYKVDNGSTLYGFMYTGSLVSGTYAVTSINVPGAANTVPHSTAGDIVVGTYDTGSPSTGNGFIYSITSGTYQTLNIGSGVSLYGAWQITGTTYAIVGGAPNPDSLGDGSEAYLATYNSVTGELSDEMYYSFTGPDGKYNHFEGITAVDGGYYLMGTVTGTTGLDSPVGAAAAFVAVNSGTYSATPVWTVVDYPDSTLTTGNTIYQNVAMGVYTSTSVSGNQSYTAIVPEPGPIALVGLGLSLAGLIAFRGTLRKQAPAG